MLARTELPPDKVAALGEAVYDKIKAEVEANDFGHYLVINVDTGMYEMGNDYILPTERLLSEDAAASLYALRIGYRAVGRIGARFTPHGSHG